MIIPYAIIAKLARWFECSDAEIIERIHQYGSPKPKTKGQNEKETSKEKQSPTETTGPERSEDR